MEVNPFETNSISNQTPRTESSGLDIVIISGDCLLRIGVETSQLGKKRNTLTFRTFLRIFFLNVKEKYDY